MTFHVTCVHNILVRRGLLGGSLLENSCSIVCNIATSSYFTVFQVCTLLFRAIMIVRINHIKAELSS